MKIKVNNKKTQFLEKNEVRRKKNKKKNKRKRKRKKKEKKKRKRRRRSRPSLLILAPRRARRSSWQRTRDVLIKVRRGARSLS